MLSGKYDILTYRVRKSSHEYNVFQLNHNSVNISPLYVSITDIAPISF